MTSTTQPEVALRMQKFAKDNLAPLCFEMKRRLNGESLPADAKLWTLVSICSFAGHTATSLAEFAIADAAMAFVCWTAEGA